MGRTYNRPLHTVRAATVVMTSAALLFGMQTARAARRARPTASGTGIRFQAASDGSLVAVQAFWRHPGSGCALGLYADDHRHIGDLIAQAPLGAEAGWASTPLGASLTGGAAYHLLATCEGGRAAHLGSVRRLRGASAGTWSLERVSRGHVHRRRGKSPLFALALADGTWWGQPYRPTRPLRLCGGGEVRQAIAPARGTELTGIDVPLHGASSGAPVELGLTAADGSVLLETRLERQRTRHGDRLMPAASPSVLTLTAGQTYTVALRVARKARGCVRLVTRSTELPLGTPATGLLLGQLSVSTDSGKTWTGHPSALALGLVDGPTPPGGGDPTPPVCTGNRCQPEPRSYRSIYVSGYFGSYDSATVPVWPKRMGVILGEANAQGPLVAAAKRTAASAGNPDARFAFYFSLTSIDSRCACFDEDFYRQIAASHPEFFLRDGGGARISTFVDQYGAQRQFAVDIGNPRFIDAWADYALAGMEQFGWDGVWIDNVVRGNFYGWSGSPVNPRTGARYTTADYRQDMLAALRQIRRRLDARGKIMIGNQSDAWRADTFSDPVVRDQITAMHGLEIEDCVYTFDGAPHSEAEWIAQLRYLDFANRHGVLTQCRGGNGTFTSPDKREYILASYLLTKEGLSNVGQLNHLSDWWDVLTTDLGAPRGGFTCLDPASGLARANDCPSPGKVYAREWQRGRALVNPSANRTVTVPLHATFVHQGQQVTTVTLPPRSGVVLTKP